ncbi:hypothetical protein [Deinococcus altitudinis]|uniref:hypothetical protein n=1 Tax=Deinococcus altitudinis TaxID=468914 RepID=UPI0038925D03
MTDPRPTTREGRKAGPKCDAKHTKRDGTCKRPAGWGTDHPGTGRCKLHGGGAQITHGRFSNITRPRIAQLLEQFKSDPNPLDLLPELALLRAVVLDYVERHDILTEALLSWNASYTSGYLEAVKLWRGQMAQWVEEQEQAFSETREPPPPPIPTDFEAKPRQLPDLASVGGLIDKIGSMAERVHKREADQKITLTDFTRVLEQLGVEVVMAVKEVVTDDPDDTRTPSELRIELVGNVERRWATVRL